MCMNTHTYGVAVLLFSDGQHIVQFIYMNRDKASMDENGYVKIVGRIKVFLLTEYIFNTTFS